ncbi:MAG: hypothetical protein KF861_07870 [Planctomycetaceae bacterium]|nr:hypothetical protein [Planctomycetaceae bacterium]
MDVEIGEQIVLWTARFAVATYLLRLWGDVDGWPDDPARRRRRETWVRVVWTLGCAVYLLHVVAAFQFVHHWSHTAAAVHTAEQTAAVTGWQWGGGLWINYLFTLWWPLDVAWSWQRGLDRMPRRYVIGMRLIVGFLVFNATVVFGPSWWRWLAAAVPAGLFARRARQLAAAANG